MNRRRVRAIVRKELNEYRRTGNVVIATTAILPLVFVISPLITAFRLSPQAAAALHHQHTMIYMLAIPVLVPATLAAQAVVGERSQGTLEPVLSTPIRREELLLGKFLAAFAPSVLIAYAMFGLYVAVVEIFAKPGVAAALIKGPDVGVQILFTPFLAAWSIWVGIAISTRVGDTRTAQQFSVLVSLPVVVVTSLISYGVIPADRRTTVLCAAILLALVRIGMRVAVAQFDRERLITNTK
jgi:ABC-type Na+ efflux pump permease subunit